MTFITLAFVTTISPAHISLIVHDFDVSSCSISCQSVKIECVNARVWSGENARRHIHPVACVDQCSIVSYDRLLVIKRTISKRKYDYFWDASLNSHQESNIITHTVPNLHFCQKKINCWIFGAKTLILFRITDLIIAFNFGAKIQQYVFDKIEFLDKK